MPTLPIRLSSTVHSSIRRPTALILALAALAIGAATTESAAAQAEADSDSTATERPIAVRVLGRNDQPPATIRPGEIGLEVGGVTRSGQVVLERPPTRRVTLYLDAALSSRSSLQRAANDLIPVLDELLTEAELEIVTADPNPRTLLPATRRPDAARNALDRVFLTLESEDALERVRREFRDLREPSLEERRDAAELETAMLRRQFDRLLLWLDAQPASAAEGADHVLVLVHDALDLNPTDFYAAGADDAGLRELFRVTSQRPEPRELAQVAAANGWGIATFARGDGREGRLDYAPDEERPVGFTLRLGGTGERTEADEETARLTTIDDSAWPGLSEATAGAVLGAEADQRRGNSPGEDLLLLLRSRFLTSLPSALQGQPLNASSERGAWSVSTAGVVPSPAPRSLAAARLRAAFDNDSEADQDFDVDAELVLGRIAGERDAAELRVDLEEALTVLRLDDGRQDALELRLTVAVHTQEDEISIQTYERELSPGATSTPEGGEDLGDIVDPRIERIPLRLPPAADSVAVVVSDLESGAWGLAFADLADRQIDAIEDDAVPERTRAVTLIPLGPEPRTGKTLIRTQVTEDVARVVYYLNGKRVGRRSRAPFDAEINLGDRPRTSQLVVAAFDRSGNELDRDRMLINEPPQSFWVRIVEPEAQDLVAGPVEVEAQLRVPVNADLDRVEYYWKDRLLETADEPPFRRTIRIPLNEPDGFLRVAATLRDGRVAEDVLVTSRSGFGDTIGVELVELYVVATDRSGKPVRGLEEADFRVVEDGDPQTLESFTAAGDLPLTLGLAIDTSSSLFLKMPEVRSAARRFVRSLRDGRDRAFLLGFGSEPTMIRSITGDLGAVERSIESLEPYGATAVWGAINQSLEQLDTVTGRRALVVFYDGDDEDREREYERSMRLARRARLPVYLIVLNDEAARTSGRSLSSRSFANRLERIGRAGGGRVYFVGTDDELDPIFESISEELRSHYLLTYYPQLEPGGPLWRPVQVDVTRRGIEARTVEGRELEP